MNIHDIYISFDIIDLIMKKLNLKSKIKFSQINQEIYNDYKNKLIKYKIYNLINHDYLEFYQYLYNNHFTSPEINELLIISIQNIPNVYKNNICGFYDLKYIFELLFINQNHLLPDNEIKKINPHFFIHFYHKLIKCLDKNRENYKNNIEKSKYLISLHRNFNGYYKSNIIIRSIGLPRYKKSDQIFYQLI